MLKCCIIGHRNIEITNDLKVNIKNKLHILIQKGVTEFLLGSRSQFVDLCNILLIELQDKFPCIKRIYVRAEYPFISDKYFEYLKTLYDDSYFYDKDGKSHKLNYVKRNEYLVDCSDVCLFYFNSEYIPLSKTKSGTRLAYEYAIKNNKNIINLYK